MNLIWEQIVKITLDFYLSTYITEIMKKIRIIRYTDGSPDYRTCSFKYAELELSRKYPEFYMENCGGRMLVWPTEKDSVNDDGSKAIAEIISEPAHV
jgi:hypothetical protein